MKQWNRGDMQTVMEGPGNFVVGSVGVGKWGGVL